MLGKKLVEYRCRENLSLNELSYLSGVSKKTLLRLETGELKHLDYVTLGMLTPHLKLTSAEEFIHLTKITRKPDFLLFNVGLARTGTSSMYSIFRNYHACHEFRFKKTSTHIQKFQRQEISKQEFDDFIINRLYQEGLHEFDSASFSHFYLPLLLNLFPNAKFIFTIRDCFSWVNSVIDYTMTRKWNKVWLREYISFYFQIPDHLIGNIPEFQKDQKQYIEKLLIQWAVLNTKILEQLPSERVLILKTSDISKSLDKIACFAGVPVESLQQDPSHQNRSPQKLGTLQSVERDFIAPLYKRHCSRLMEKYFPNEHKKYLLAGVLP